VKSLPSTVRVLLLLGTMMLPLQSHADPAPGSSLEEQATEASFEGALEPVPTESVVIDGVVLFRLRGVSTYTAEVRAAEIGGRIMALARDKNISVDALRIEEHELGSAIMAGDRLIMIVVEPDARVEGVAVKLLAATYLQAIKRTVSRYRHDREPGVLAWGAAYALGAILAATLMLYGLYRLYRLLDLKIRRHYRTRLDDLKIEGFKVLQAEHMWAVLRAALGGLHALIGLTLLYLTLNFSLRQFPVTRGAAANLLDVVIAPLVTIGTGLLGMIPDLVFLAILTVLTRFLLKTLKLFFGAIEQGAVKISGFDAEWGQPTYRIVRLMVVAFALVVAYPYIPGSHSDAFKGVSLFIGVIFSIGSSSFVSNIIAGYAMTYRRAFSLGDRIRVGDVMGDVTAVRMQVTHLRSLKNEEIIIPNSTILSTNVVNYSRLATTEGLILHTTVGIGYETPWRQVEAMLLMAAERTPAVLRSPASYVLQKSLGDFAITYELNCYCDRPSEMNNIYTELHRNILDVFNEYGVAIMTPAYEGDTEAPKVVARDKWFTAPAKAPD